MFKSLRHTDMIMSVRVENKAIMMLLTKTKEYFRKMKVYEKVKRERALEEAGKTPIKVRWVDTNKGTSTKPNYRSRLVAMEFKIDQRPELYSATPPLEMVKVPPVISSKERFPSFAFCP